MGRLAWPKMHREWRKRVVGLTIAATIEEFIFFVGPAVVFSGDFFVECLILLRRHIIQGRTCIENDVVDCQLEWYVSDLCVVYHDLPVNIWINLHPVNAIWGIRYGCIIFAIFLHWIQHDFGIVTTELHRALTSSVCEVDRKHRLLNDPVFFQLVYEEMHLFPRLTFLRFLAFRT